MWRALSLAFLVLGKWESFSHFNKDNGALSIQIVRSLFLPPLVYLTFLHGAFL
jgi:hypothetical protein